LASGVKPDPLKLVKNFPIRQEQIRAENGGGNGNGGSKSWELMSVLSVNS